MSNPVDDKGNVRVDRVWGNVPMQPNDVRVANGGELLDPVLDNHEIVYLGWNGFPAYTPAGSTPPTPPATVVTFENVFAGIEQDGISTIGLYGSLEPFRLQMPDASGFSDTPSFYQEGGGFAESATFQWQLKVDESTEIGAKLKAAYDQQEEMYQAIPPNFKDTMGVPGGGGVATQQLARNTWYSDFVPLAPKFSFAGARNVDNYGVDAPFNLAEGTVSSKVTEFVDSSNELKLLVPGADLFSDDKKFMVRTVPNPVEYPDEAFYDFFVSYPASSGSYGEIEDGLFGEDGVTINASTLGFTYNRSFFTLDGTIVMTLPAAPAPITTAKTFTLEIENNVISDDVNKVYSIPDSMSMFGTEPGPFRIQTGSIDMTSFFTGSNGVRLTFSLDTDADSDMDNRLTQALLEQDLNWGSLASSDAVNYDDYLAWYEEYVPSRPKISLSQAALMDNYGSVRSNGDVELSFSDNMDMATSLLVPGFDDGMTDYPLLRRVSSRSAGKNRYVFNLSFPTNASSYGDFPSIQEAAMFDTGTLSEESFQANSMVLEGFMSGPLVGGTLTVSFN